MSEEQKSFLNLLDQKHEEFLSKEKTLENFISGIEVYESVIPTFFSASGEANGIKSMYQLIKEYMPDEKHIVCTDVNKGASIYNEYLEGMMKFIHQINETDFAALEGSDVSFTEKLNKAKSNDSAFIESLYGGTVNENIELVLSEAAQNVEFLIDFIPQLKSLKSMCTTLVTECTQDSIEIKKDLIQESLKMLFESAENYSYKTLHNIMETYYGIQTALHESADGQSVFVLL